MFAQPFSDKIPIPKQPGIKLHDNRIWRYGRDPMIGKDASYDPPYGFTVPDGKGGWKREFERTYFTPPPSPQEQPQPARRDPPTTTPAPNSRPRQ